MLFVKKVYMSFADLNFKNICSSFDLTESVSKKLFNKLWKALSDISFEKQSVSDMRLINCFLKQKIKIIKTF